VRAGEADVVGHDYEALTGKQPLTIAGALELYREEMPLGRKAPA
jgi:hypothetical protein